ncbi:WD40 repeat-like protein [Delitschia confertaspora ATCC 74209]|uniref:WD40 repeat-like protein n=1 Tax=Delitschia confertaspora ATCC 74209 TaxID=1513339 RepID=A0A9P4JH45_9PLEO|nr:WD40 repeat-like protein [Delitschia confertaspora ATCC 74209]
MAWQSPSAMNTGGAPSGGDGHGPAGTEYTLQGVMRFLQLEWHNHERARNAWDIERAEMKAKIAKQEGEVRSAKKMNDSLNRHIRMLEQALMKERAKSKAAAGNADAQGMTDDKKDSKGKATSQSDTKSGTNPTKPPSKPHNSFLDIDPEQSERADVDSYNQREKSRLYLTKCVEEITYLLTPPAQLPPPQAGLQGLNGTGFLNHGDATLEEMYLHRQRMQGHMGNPAASSLIPNHQLHANSSVPDIHNLPHISQPMPQAPSMSREPSSQLPLSRHTSMGPSEILGAQPHVSAGPAFSVPEEQVEKITHTFDNQGHPVPNRDDELQSRQTSSEDSENWNFEEPVNSTAGPAPEVPPPRRPDTDIFPNANSIPAKSPPRALAQSHRRRSSGSSSMSRRKNESHEPRESVLSHNQRSDPQNFKVRFALRGHLDVVRSVIFTGGGSPSEPEICTAGDDGMIKRWIIPASYATQHGTNNDLDIQSYFSHRGHEGVVTSLAACPASASFSTGGRVSGDGWIFSGGQDATIRVWERGRVDPKATLEGHTDAVWTVCVLPATCGSVFGQDSNNYGGPDRILLASGSADGTLKIWAVSAPPQLVSPQTGSRRGVGGSRRHSVTSGSNYPSSPQPSVATTTPFHYTLVHTIERATHPSPTCISPLSVTGDNFVVAFSDASILIYDTRTGEEIIGMASAETYDGTPATGITSVVATAVGAEGTMSIDSGRGVSEEESVVHGPTGSNNGGGVEGVVISGHEDQFIRFFDANSGQCTYSMLAHPSAISSLSLSKDGREAVSAGHDASIRFWSLEKRICTQEITSHRIMRGEGVCSVVWSQDGRLVVSAGGDGVVKVFAR